MECFAYAAVVEQPTIQTHARRPESGLSGLHCSSSGRWVDTLGCTYRSRNRSQVERVVAALCGDAQVGQVPVIRALHCLRASHTHLHLHFILCLHSHLRLCLHLCLYECEGGTQLPAQTEHGCLHALQVVGAERGASLTVCRLWLEPMAALIHCKRVCSTSIDTCIRTGVRSGTGGTQGSSGVLQAH